MSRLRVRRGVAVALLGASLVLPGCDHNAAPAGSRQPRHKPSCEELRRTARHELGDTSGEIERHCVRDR